MSALNAILLVLFLGFIAASIYYVYAVRKAKKAVDIKMRAQRQAEQARKVTPGGRSLNYSSSTRTQLTPGTPVSRTKKRPETLADSRSDSAYEAPDYGYANYYFGSSDSYTSSPSDSGYSSGSSCGSDSGYSSSSYSSDSGSSSSSSDSGSSGGGSCD